MKFYVTFGQGQYGRLFKDYYVEIEATDIHDAINKTKDAFDNKYASIYEETVFDTKDYPKGSLGKL